MAAIQRIKVDNPVVEMDGTNCLHAWNILVFSNALPQLQEHGFHSCIVIAHELVNLVYYRDEPALKGCVCLNKLFGIAGDEMTRIIWQMIKDKVQPHMIANMQLASITTFLTCLPTSAHPPVPRPGHQVLRPGHGEPRRH
jgi:hypothetical protein